MSNESQTSTRSNPFASLFEDVQPGQFSEDIEVKPSKATSREKQQAAHEAALETGYSRPVSVALEKPKQKKTKPALAPKKPEMVQFSVRAKADVIGQFRKLLDAQEPNWSLGYGLERAVKALQNELNQK